MVGFPISCYSCVYPQFYWRVHKGHLASSIVYNEPNRNMNPGLKIKIGPWEVNKHKQPVTTTCADHSSLARQNNNINTFHTKQVKKLCLVQHKQSQKNSCERIDCRQNTKYICTGRQCRVLQNKYHILTIIASYMSYVYKIKSVRSALVPIITCIQ